MEMESVARFLAFSIYLLECEIMTFMLVMIV